MPKLPPRVGKVDSRNFLRFVPTESVDFTFVGYLLACHLTIEHYLDEFLKSRAPELNWDGGKLNFSQKAALFPHRIFPEGEEAIAGIRHMNALRNKLAHRMDAKPDDFDYLPFVRFLEKDPHPNADPIPTIPMELLEAFVDKLSSFFIGWLASDAYRTTWRQGDNKQQER
ncbi:hypothetical protein [Duganella phyllosphaerae]|uniref:hypothetical protein n=1 Tax=Duganella phyllosphaerae TaxID=762836 RepID=UPI00114D243C|nr:hypothetical protein [Duganella phyllosphaerae]